MKLVVLSALLLPFFCACKSPNPLNCADGNCNDPAYPFCDVDGMLGGTPNTCIAVDCTPMSVVACHGEDALICHADGNNLVPQDCEVGCVEEKGCVACIDSSDCENPDPICDVAMNECRRCTTDDECLSGVCERDEGTCMDEVRVLYVASDGLNDTDCLNTAPCSIFRAFQIADMTRSTIRLADGNYMDEARLEGSKAVTIVGNSATKIGNGSTNLLNVLNGASLSVRGAHLLGTAGMIRCGSISASPPAVIVLESVEMRGVNIEMGKCEMTISKSLIDWTAGDDAIVQMGGSLNIEQSRIVGAASGISSGIGMGTSNESIRIVNSTLENIPVGGGDSASGGNSTLILAFNTFVKTTTAYPAAIVCGDFDVNPIIQNNIVHSNDSSIFGRPCRDAAQNNILFPQTETVPASNIKQDPMLTNPAPGGDFSLRASSPAIDRAATPTIPSADTDVDIVGTPRPQGVRADIGAYEYVP